MGLRFSRVSTTNRSPHALLMSGSISGDGFGANYVREASGFGLRASGFGLRASGFGLRASGFGLRASGFGLRASGFGLRASGFGLRASGFGLRASGFGLRASGFGLREVFPVFLDNGSRQGSNPHIPFQPRCCLPQRRIIEPSPRGLIAKPPAWANWFSVQMSVIPFRARCMVCSQ